MGCRKWCGAPWNLSTCKSGHLEVARGGLREAHLPTEQPSSCEEARLPQPHEHPGRTGRVEGPSRQGSPPPVGLIWAIRERSAFAQVSSQGQRARAGVLWCTFILDPPNSDTPPRVAFALGRALGSAVVRNRVRRRLRALLQRSSSQAELPPGTYLFGAVPAAASLSSPELQFDLNLLLQRVRG
jgi:ribonuclease P protein component